MRWQGKTRGVLFSRHAEQALASCQSQARHHLRVDVKSEDDLLGDEMVMRLNFKMRGLVGGCRVNRFLCRRGFSMDFS